jgi:hypothetical protein
MTRPTFSLHPRSRGAAALAIGVLLALLQLSCATSSSPPQGNPMPAARASLRPEYRVFYDELRDYGDWVLIEPFGFVFRPRTRFATWSPYYDGFWSPSDSYGWVWVSGEPFGWATYHYGAWIEDDYQGWVWVPGLEWAPAWVAWTGNQDFVGWAALAPNGDPAGRFTVVPRGDLGATDLRSHILPQERAKVAIESARPIENFTEVDKVMVNRGPDISWVEQKAGPLTRARVEDVNLRRAFNRGAAGTPATTAEKPSPATSSPPASTNEFHKTAESAAAKARTIMQQKQAAPDVIPRLQVTDAPVRPAPPTSTPKPAKRDSVR